MDAVSLGPFVVSFERFLALVALLAFVLSAELMAKKTDARLASWATNSVVIGLIGARLGFVLLHLATYIKAPQTVFYIWQGGFTPLAGVFVAALYTVWFYRATLKDLKWTLAPSLIGFTLWMSLAGFALTRAPSLTSLPSVSVLSGTGEIVELSSFQGQPSVINLWATWCGPCQRELPMLAQAQAEHKDIHFVFIDQQESAEKVAQYLAERDLTLENSLLDLRGEVADIVRLKGTPTTLFFDAKGTLMKRHVGEISRAALEDELRRIRQ